MTPSTDPAAAQTGFLSLRHLTKEYAGFTAVSNLTLDVPKGELVAFLGPSGCGKTTSLRMIAGLVPATSGRILVGGRDLTSVPAYRRDMGLVFQSYALFPHMTVAANVAFGLKMRRIGRAEAAERVREAIALVHLQGREDRKPSQLSGGQQQRVALARALVVRPQILLLDEPLSNLDAKLRDEMRTEIRDIQQRLGITAIFVTHDQGEALTMCDKVAVLNGGALEQMGTPQDLYERPATPFVANFVGRTNQLAVTAVRGEVALGAARLHLAGGQSGPVDLMVRPHRIRLVPGLPMEGCGAPSDHVVGGTVRRVTYAGDLLQYEVDVGSHTVLVEWSTRADDAILDQGAPVTLAWRAEDTLVFAKPA
jgi:putative spermidine/putrescine transport system ATP-binding protein